MADPERPTDDPREAARQDAQAIANHLEAHPTDTVTVSVVDGDGQTYLQGKVRGPGALIEPRETLLGPDGQPLATPGRRAGRLSVGFSSSKWKSPWTPGADQG